MFLLKLVSKEGLLKRPVLGRDVVTGGARFDERTGPT
jgi:hypothetical protein